MLASPARLAAQSGGVEIIGFSPNNVMMKWTVKNVSAGAVSRLEFPIGRVNRTDPPPEGWEIKQFDRLKTGLLIYESTSAAHDIRRGESLEFVCTMDRSARDVKEGTVTAILRDGSSIQVPGVQLPVAHAFWEVYGLPLFLAALLGMVVLFRLARRAREPARVTDASTPSPENPTPDA